MAPVRTLTLLLGLLAGTAAALPHASTTLARGLDDPTGIAALGDGRVLIAERGGTLRLVVDGALVDEPVDGVPEVHVRAEAGLLDVAAHPGFPDPGWIYLSLVQGDQDANTLHVVRGRLDDRTLVDVEAVFSAEPGRRTAVHYGGRLHFLPDGTLLASVGDGFDYREEAQRPDSHFGALVRIGADGAIPADNPHRDRDDPGAAIFSHGHLAISGLAADPASGTLWAVEPGPGGGDELNRITAGGDYGWPVASHGPGYSGARVTPHRSLPGRIDPVHVWERPVEPADLLHFRGDAFPDLRGHLLMAAQHVPGLLRIEIDGEAVVGIAPVFEDLGRSIRAVRQAPDGGLLLLSSPPEPELLHLAPAGD